MLENFIQSNSFNNAISKLQKGDKLVFCDIDGTIYRDSLFLDVVEHLIQDGFIEDEKSQKYYQYKEQWKEREINYEKYLMYTVLEIYEKTLHKVPYDYLENIAPGIIEDKGKRIFLFTLNKLRELQQQGYKIIFVSGSPLILVNEFAKRFGFDIGLGSYSSKDNNGNLKREYVLASSQAKLDVINIIVDKVKPSEIISFGDTTGDYAMLINSDIGYAINPTSGLYEKIKDSKNILAIIERKDLILELDVDDRKGIKYYALL